MFYFVFGRNIAFVLKIIIIKERKHKDKIRGKEKKIQTYFRCFAGSISDH